MTSRMLNRLRTATKLAAHHLGVLALLRSTRRRGCSLVLRYHAVAPGAEYERVRAEIMAAVAALRDPATGASLCRQVLRKEEVHSGPHLDNVPDILLVTADGVDGGHDVDRLFSPVPEATLRNLSGTHTMEGIFIAAGTPFRKTARLEAVGLADILPTALYLAGPGLVLPDVMGTYGDNGNALSVGEEREMRKFLQDLGYIE